MQTTGNRFYKEERLCSKKQIEYLFEKGRSFNIYPLRMMVTETGADMKFPVQAMFVVPKKNFKRAADRNKLRRRMREIYRLNKTSAYSMLQNDGRKVILALLYTAKKKEEFGMIESSLLKLLSKI